MARFAQRCSTYVPNGTVLSSQNRVDFGDNYKTEVQRKHRLTCSHQKGHPLVRIVAMAIPAGRTYQHLLQTREVCGTNRTVACRGGTRHSADKFLANIDHMPSIASECLLEITPKSFPPVVVVLTC